MVTSSTVVLGAAGAGGGDLAGWAGAAADGAAADGAGGLVGAAACAGWVLMIALRVAAKAARLAGSFNTSSAACACSAEMPGDAACGLAEFCGLPGVCAADGFGTPRSKAHRNMRTTRIICRVRPQMTPSGQRLSGETCKGAVPPCAGTLRPRLAQARFARRGSGMPPRGRGNSALAWLSHPNPSTTVANAPSV